MLENYLPKELLKNLKSRLVAKDKDLKKQEEHLVEEDPYMQPGRATDNAEMMDEAILEDSQKVITDVTLNAVQRMRIEIKKALALMKIGKYGICEVCGASIDKARLEAYPEATTCVSCASKKS